MKWNTETLPIKDGYYPVILFYYGTQHFYTDFMRYDTKTQKFYDHYGNTEYITVYGWCELPIIPLDFHASHPLYCN